MELLRENMGKGVRIWEVGKVEQGDLHHLRGSMQLREVNVLRLPGGREGS